jgi:hypothetical protein
MIWPWSRRAVEAARAADAAEADLERVRARRPEVENLGARNRRHRELNNLSQLWEQLLNGGKP